jgi:diguanylate cyclase (GGDEF)-like protein
MPRCFVCWHDRDDPDRAPLLPRFWAADAAIVKVPSGFDRQAFVRPLWRPGPALSLRGWLTAFALLVCFAVIAVFAVNTVHEREIATGVAGRTAQNLAEALAQQASDTVEAVDGGLLTLSERVQNDGTGPQGRDGLQEAIAGLASTMPQLHGLFVVDDQGRLLASGFAAAPSDLRFRELPYFRYHRDDPGPNIHISGPMRDKTENGWVICVTRRLDHLDGSFAGVAIAQIDLSYFDQAYANVDVGQAGTITLISADGIIMDRKPRTFIGRSLRESTLFADPLRDQQSGTYVRSSAVDGKPRLFAFRRLDRYPLIVDVGLADSEYLAGWRSAARTSSVELACVIAMIGGLAGGLGVQIGRRKTAEDSLARLALLDGLTELANRRHFDVVLEREWRRSARDHTPLALLMIDVDNFKTYNDTFGHQHGDAALIAIARAIAGSVVRPSDAAARYGGEEFAVILPVTSASNAVTVAERIRHAVLALGLPHADARGGILSTSIGVASVVPVRSGDRSKLIEAADAELYKAKRAGRNNVSVLLDEPEPGPELIPSVPSPA